jgi:hypothetical protein
MISAAWKKKRSYYIFIFVLKNIQISSFVTAITLQHDANHCYFSSDTTYCGILKLLVTLWKKGDTFFIIFSCVVKAFRLVHLLRGAHPNVMQTIVTSQTTQIIVTLCSYFL